MNSEPRNRKKGGRGNGTGSNGLLTRVNRNTASSNRRLRARESKSKCDGVELEARSESILKGKRKG